MRSNSTSAVGQRDRARRRGLAWGRGVLTVLFTGAYAPRGGPPLHMGRQSIFGSAKSETVALDGSSDAAGLMSLTVARASYRAGRPALASSAAAVADDPRAASGQTVGATSARAHAAAKRLCTAAASSVLP